VGEQCLGLQRYRRSQPVGDPFEYPGLVVGIGDPAAADPVGVMKGEDLVSPLEQAPTQPFELLEGMLGGDVEERCRRLVSLGVIGGGVAAVEVCKLSPGFFQIELPPRTWASAVARSPLGWSQHSHQPAAPHLDP
jgi:hypothetical protein